MTPRAYRDGLHSRLVKLCRDAGVRQADVARATGAAHGQVNAWFRNTAAVPAWHIPAIARLLGCSTGFLQFGEPE